MRSRQEIKYYAKQAFAAQKTNCILGLFLVLLLAFGFGMVSSIPSLITSIPALRGYFNIRIEALAVLTAVSGVITLISIPLMLLTIVLDVNICGFFVKVFYAQPVIPTEPYSAVKFNFGRKLGGMLWQSLWLYLWSLPTVIPGTIILTILMVSIMYTQIPVLFAIIIIFALFVLMMIPVTIKALSYSMTPYLLACNPNVTAINALNLSKRMTKGYKGEILMMALSFVGWQLLNMLTLGILGIFYVNPYMYASFAGLFIELRNVSVANGVVHISELDGLSAYYPQPQQYQQNPYYQPQQYQHPQQFEQPQQFQPPQQFEQPQQAQYPLIEQPYIPQEQPIQQPIEQPPQYTEPAAPSPEPPAPPQEPTAQQPEPQEPPVPPPEPPAPPQEPPASPPEPPAPSPEPPAPPDNANQ